MKKSWVFRLVMRLYPADFRHRYGEEMEEVFCANVNASGTPFARSIGWCKGLVDLVARIPRQRLLKRRGRGGAGLAEIRQGCRRLLRHRWQSGFSVLVVAVGIASATAAFALLHGVVLEALPYPDANRLVRIFQYKQAGSQLGDPWQRAYQSIIQHASTLSGVAVVRPARRIFLDEAPARRILVHEVNGDFFSLLGIAPVLGRTPGRVDGREQAVILSHAFWQSQYGGDPDVVGRQISLLEVHPHQRKSYRVLGVMPVGFASELVEATGPDLWLPVPLAPPTPRTFTAKPVIARLAPGISAKAVEAELNPQIEAAELEATAAGAVSVYPLQQAVIGKHGRLFWMVMVAVGCLLAICSLNFAGLMIANLRVRRSEMAIRRALGAGLPRILATLLAESLPLAILGGGLGILLSYWALPLILSLSPHNIPRLQGVDLGVQTLLFSGAAALLLGLLSTCLALPWRPDLQGLRTAGGRLLGSRPGKSRTAIVFVTAEIALAVLLLFCGTLLTNALIRLYAVDPGYRTEDVLTFEFPQPLDQSMGGLTAMQVREGEILERIQELPGVQLAAAGAVPFRGYGKTGIYPEEAAPDSESTKVFLNDVSPDYFSLLEIELLRGRSFNREDHENAVAVAIVNEALAEKLWPGQDPLGKRVTRSLRNLDWITVVGLVRDVRERALDSQPEPELYIPYLQSRNFDSGTFLVRVNGDPVIVRQSILREISNWNPERTMADVKMLEELIAESLAERRFVAWLLNILSGISLLLAGAGLYSVTASLVAERTREVGLRMALGAEARDILRLFLGWGLTITAVGLILGLPVAWASSGFFERWLFLQDGYIWPVFVTVAFTTGCLALAGCIWPSWRAARLDPLDALRHE